MSKTTLTSSSSNIMIFTLSLEEIKKIFGTYSTTESSIFSKNSLLFSERGCQDPIAELDSFTVFEEPFRPVMTKEKRERYDLSNLDSQLCDSAQSDWSQRYKTVWI